MSIKPASRFLNQICFVLFFNSWLVQSCYALDLDIRQSSANLLDFSFIIDSSTIEYFDENYKTVVDVDLTRTGVLVYDVPESGPHFGLALGYSFGDLSNHPVFQPIDMDGWYVGILVRGIAYETARFAITMEGQYIYQDLNGADTTRSASLRWNEYAVNATFHIALNEGWRLFAAPVYGDINATYRDQDIVNQTLKITANTNTGFLGGIRYKMGTRDFVSLQYQEYTYRGAVLRFRRLF